MKLNYEVHVYILKFGKLRIVRLLSDLATK
jgi:hypothetical protein